MSSSVTDGPECLSVPGVRDFVAVGWEPLEFWTGASFLGPLWPADLKTSVPETRPHMLIGSRDGRLWMVRSPWPDVSVKTVLDVLWLYLEHDQPPASDRALAESRSAEVLSWDGRRIREEIAAHHLDNS